MTPSLQLLYGLKNNLSISRETQQVNKLDHFEAVKIYSLVKVGDFGPNLAEPLLKGAAGCRRLL
ncbi:unannotated protein [freshwater metagenome]|uniref:Unannotated protein n=1 Tax=freshwater metagenome TaxID=449393 RepID=A0A6J7FT71_9ZZZZ